MLADGLHDPGRSMNASDLLLVLLPPIPPIPTSSSSLLLFSPSTGSSSETDADDEDVEPGEAGMTDLVLLNAPLSHRTPEEEGEARVEAALDALRDLVPEDVSTFAHILAFWYDSLTRCLHLTSPVLFSPPPEACPHKPELGAVGEGGMNSGLRVARSAWSTILSFSREMDCTCT